jgi:putative transposase
MKQYPRKPPRFKESDSIYFLTFCTFKRKPILHIDTIPEFLIDELIYYKSRIKNLLAYTIMPDHIHLLIEIEDTKSMSTFLRDFKKYTSRELRRRIKEDRLLQ